MIQLRLAGSKALSCRKAWPCKARAIGGSTLFAVVRSELAPTGCKRLFREGPKPRWGLRQFGQARRRSASACSAFLLPIAGCRAMFRKLRKSQSIRVRSAAAVKNARARRACRAGQSIGSQDGRGVERARYTDSRGAQVVRHASDPSTKEVSREMTDERAHWIREYRINAARMRAIANSVRNPAERQQFERSHGS